MDKRVDNLVRLVQAMPAERRRREARELCDRLSWERDLYRAGPKAVVRYGRFMDCLNRFGGDCVYDDRS